MENKDLQVRTFLNANGTPFYPKTRWSAIIDAPDIEATINNILEEGNYVSDANYVHTDNNFTDVLKEKLDGLRRETFQISGMYRNSVLTLDNVPSARELSTMVSQCVVLTVAVLFADVSSNDIRLFYLKEFTGSEFIFSHVENKSSKVIESEIKIYSNGTYAITFKEIEIPEPTKDVVVVKADISGTTVSNASHSYAQLIEHIQNGDVVLLELRGGAAFHFYSLTDTSRASGVEVGPLVFSRIFLNGSDKSASDSTVSLSQNNTWSYSETYVKIPESINDFYPTYYYQFQDGDTLRYDGSRWQVGNFDELPSQTGNSGKFLTTNGSVVSWAKANVQSDWSQTDDTADDFIKNKPTISTVRTMNGEQLTDSSLGDINIHDGFYFPNAIQDADGNWYGAVVIGNQVWMGENFKCTSFPNGTPITNGSPSANGGVLNFSNVEARYYISDDDSSTIDEFGLEYNSRALFNESSPSSLNPSGVQGIAPQGWHIPSCAEYDQLLNYVVSQKRYISESPYDEQYPEANQYQTNSLCCSLSEIAGDQDKINATGFNWKLAPSQDDDFAFHSTFLATADYDEIESDLSVPMVGCSCWGIYINTYDGCNINNPPDLICGLHVRLISDLTPIQFRNWYVSTYGTMQHYLPPEDTSDNIQYGTTSYWNSRVGYIPPAGTIIVYSDYATKTVNNETIYIPNIKIGSGNGYVQDLEFIGEKEAADLLAHTSNTNIHVTASDKTNWNSKLNVDDNNEVSNETLIFIRN